MARERAQRIVQSCSSTRRSLRLRLRQVARCRNTSCGARDARCGAVENVPDVTSVEGPRTRPATARCNTWLYMAKCAKSSLALPQRRSACARRAREAAMHPRPAGVRAAHEARQGARVHQAHVLRRVSPRGAQVHVPLCACSP